MSNKNKTIALASLIAAGAGVAAVAASNSHKQAKAKKIAEKQQAESGTPYRNTERGKYEKNSKGIYYTNGNYEAFAHPKKPEGVDEKSAYIVGSGLASLAAACFLVRDGQMPGDHIHILEAMDIAGGACDGIFDPSRGYVMRGGRSPDRCSAGRTAPRTPAPQAARPDGIKTWQTQAPARRTSGPPADAGAQSRSALALTSQKTL